MKTTSSPHYSASSVNFDYAECDWDVDSTPISQPAKKAKRVAIATSLGCMMSIAGINPHYSILPQVDTIECVADMAKNVQQEVLLVSDEELNAWDFCKTLRFSKGSMVQEGNVLLDDYLPSLNNLVQLSEVITSSMNMQVLPMYAEKLLHEVWEADLSDEPLIPGMK